MIVYWWPWTLIGWVSSLKGALIIRSLVMYVGIIFPPVHENYAMSQQLWRLEMKHCLLYLFNLADAINDQPSVLEEVPHSRSCSISLFLWVSHVSPNWWNLHIPKSEWYERIPIPEYQSGNWRKWLRRRAPGRKFYSMGAGTWGLSQLKIPFFTKLPSLVLKGARKLHFLKMHVCLLGCLPSCMLN